MKCKIILLDPTYPSPRRMDGRNDRLTKNFLSEQRLFKIDVHF